MSSYFDPTLPTEVHVYASPVGLGAILSQKNPSTNQTQIIAYASRSLTEVESHYSQIEREALRIVYGIEHFHLYLYGNAFKVITDHKPLETIFANPKCRSSARLERWCLRLQDYNFTVKYQPGNSNPSDFLSRHPLPTTFSPDGQKEEYINHIAQNAVPSAMNLEDLRQYTAEDATLQTLCTLIKFNAWDEIKHPELLPTTCDVNELKSFYKIRNELSVSQSLGIILRSNRVVIPKKLRQQVIQLAHHGHQGMGKTKQLLREKVWFPGIDNLVKIR